MSVVCPCPIVVIVIGPAGNVPTATGVIGVHVNAIPYGAVKAVPVSRTKILLRQPNPYQRVFDGEPAVAVLVPNVVSVPALMTPPACCSPRSDCVSVTVVDVRS
ncbi:MAG: hypothetical protein SGI72_03250 [Planctomycetota bacterium]|nr:hypothetical protein [Planctomycetota bacterium]